MKYFLLPWHKLDYSVLPFRQVWYLSVYWYVTLMLNNDWLSDGHSVCLLEHFLPVRYFNLTLSVACMPVTLWFSIIYFSYNISDCLNKNTNIMNLRPFLYISAVTRKHCKFLRIIYIYVFEQFNRNIKFIESVTSLWHCLTVGSLVGRLVGW